METLRQLRNGKDSLLTQKRQIIEFFYFRWKAGADKMTKKINTLAGLMNPTSRRIVFPILEFDSAIFGSSTTNPTIFA